jgi:regulator of replication initiation timing
VILINLDSNKQAKPKRQMAVRMDATTVLPSTTNKQPTTNLARQIAQLEEEEHKVRKKRAMLSTRTARVVEETVKRLRAEGPHLAKAFLQGELPDEQVKEHYLKMQACTDELIQIYDKKRHLEQYGTMPMIAPPPNSLVRVFDTPEMAMLRTEIRRLDDIIYKTREKIAKANSGLRKPRSGDKMIEWKQKILLADARREDCKRKLKHLQHEQRVGKG